MLVYTELISSCKCGEFVTAARVAASLLAAACLVLTILTKFVGPEAHLACVRQLHDMFARVLPMAPHFVRSQAA